MRVAPPLIPWATRGAGAIGIVTAVLYLALVIGAGDNANVPIAMVWFALMGGAGLLAWFADRAPARTGRRMMWAAFTLFFVIGVVSIYTIGILYLIASVLSIFSLSRRSPGPTTGAPVDPDRT